jgi:hypothetical protein
MGIDKNRKSERERDRQTSELITQSDQRKKINKMHADKCEKSSQTTGADTVTSRWNSWMNSTPNIYTDSTHTHTHGQTVSLCHTLSRKDERFRAVSS